MKTIQLFLILMLSGAISIAQTLIPTAQMALLQGTVTNFKGKVLANEIILFSNEKTNAVVKVNTDAKGRFQTLVPVNATYNLKYKTFTTDKEYTKMAIPDDKEATYEVEIKIDPPKNFVLENVYFDTGKSTLKPSSNKALNDLAEVLKLKSTMEVQIEGHTDDVGNEADNLKLSQERADAVKKYLSSKGIAAARVTAKGFGQTMPVADNATEEGRSKNRRTSLKVIKE
jgi:outer membrane protein OmpA-like peptidoglycan-associated protein